MGFGDGFGGLCEHLVKLRFCRDKPRSTLRWRCAGQDVPLVQRVVSSHTLRTTKAIVFACPIVAAREVQHYNDEPLDPMKIDKTTRLPAPRL